ncbi:unnamed protein product, partial [Candidula unifasciata]
HDPHVLTSNRFQGGRWRRSQGRVPALMVPVKKLVDSEKSKNTIKVSSLQGRVTLILLM